ncbi:MAG TPA: tetratricopeptide repeat protein [Cryomorphaceae bacterium]|nr:tetratricopeptide repeat protein [Cryomorphaceae bacterium]
MASFYLESGDYEKARLYYEKLYDKKPVSEFYKGLLLSYKELGEYKEAEKLIKKQGKRSNSNTIFIDLGEVYEAQGEDDDALKAYREAIDELPKSQGIVIRTANEFIRLNKLELALETYQEGKKLLEGRYPFSYEIAGLYGTMGDQERMISEYLDLLVYNEAYMQTIQNALNRSINFEEDGEGVEMLRTELLRRVQKTPDSVIFAEMLIWLFLQDKEFNSAYIQLKALDKRLGEDGQRLLQLAGLCTNNEAYGVAEKCYRYIADKGPSNPYYNYARTGILKSKFQNLSSTFPPDTAALESLSAEYTNTLAELGLNSETIGLMRQKALLEGYYLGDLEAANITLNRALEANIPTPSMRAEIKLDLAEILIAKDYIWDASLLASQVDKDFKNDILGSKAKFLNARISYYNGDFEWAQAQLDILKGSTSKLISNDAMELSLLISDNLNLDTILEPMLMFSRADLKAIQRDYKGATATLDSILTEYPGHSLKDEILMLKGRMAETQYDYNSAIAFYEQVLTDHYFDISADNALYRSAELYEDKLGQPNKAADLYKQLLVDFPGSLFVVEARKRFRAIRGDEPNTETPRIIPEKVP